jgi:hypothetical protein
MNININVLEKKIRSQVIKEYMQATGYTRAVCFTCGNATKALRDEGVIVDSIGAHEELVPNKWWTQVEIKNTFPQHFDATSGHLPIFLMARIAGRIRAGNRFEDFGTEIPTGSGETIVVLSMAFPEHARELTPLYNLGPETEYSEFAPLNTLVSLCTGGRT